MGKIKVTFQSLCDFFMISKLFSIVGRNRMNLVRNGVQQPFDGIFRIFFRSLVHLVNKGTSPDFLSVIETIACLWALPMIVSASQSPTRDRLSTMVDLWSMPILFLRMPRRSLDP